MDKKGLVGRGIELHGVRMLLKIEFVETVTAISMQMVSYTGPEIRSH